MNRLINSFAFASKGIRVAFREQVNLKIHLSISCLVVVVAYLLKLSTVEWAIILLCIAMVISLELVNSAIEALVDLVSPDRKEQAGKVKDIAAGAVLVAAAIASLIGLVIFGKHLFSLYV
jgi:diacylglycerol kinase